MKPDSLITMILGIVLTVFGLFLLITHPGAVGAIPLLIGGSLVYLGWWGGRTAVLVFGHICVVVGCALITWGIYLLPYSQPTFSHIIGRPLFWGMFSLFGGICSIYHGFCRCIRRPERAEAGKEL